MRYYSKKINGRFQNPENAGESAGSNAIGTYAAFECGVVLRISLQIDLTSNEIFEAKFTSNGCGFLIASADLLMEEIKGRKLTVLHGFDRREYRSLIENELGEFPSDRSHCLETGLRAVEDALANFRSFRLIEFAGEQALICTCFGVSEEAVEKIVRGNPEATVDDVGMVCNAGTGCGSCQPLIREMIDASSDRFN